MERYCVSVVKEGFVGRYQELGRGWENLLVNHPGYHKPSKWNPRPTLCVHLLGPARVITTCCSWAVRGGGSPPLAISDWPCPLMISSPSC